MMLALGFSILTFIYSVQCVCVCANVQVHTQMIFKEQWNRLRELTWVINTEQWAKRYTCTKEINLEEEQMIVTLRIVS